ncbi:hypothetical protein STVA_41630 [Allostella vacuolata]|nr:hypothetical protein STVA_41630 [Stella vacuolata]
MTAPSLTRDEARRRLAEIREEARAIRRLYPDLRSNGPRPDLARRQLAADLYRRGRTLLQVGDALGISDSGARLLLRMGVPLRPRGCRPTGAGEASP